jgi:hypothetical protein
MPVELPAKTLGHSLRVWTATLGVAGFLAGFVGPLIVNPGANQGPLLGLFVTGPGGALAGLLLGTVAGLLRMSDAIRRQSLIVCALALVLGTLYIALPGPRSAGVVIDAEVIDCSPAAHDSVASATAVVLTMHVTRRVMILEYRKPWNRGRKTAGAWSAVDTSERYYADDDGGVCSVYLRREPQLYMPFSNVTYESPSKSWPTTDPAARLSLMELRPVPADVLAILP